MNGAWIGRLWMSKQKTCCANIGSLGVGLRNNSREKRSSCRLLSYELVENWCWDEFVSRKHKLDLWGESLCFVCGTVLLSPDIRLSIAGTMAADSALLTSGIFLDDLPLPLQRSQALDRQLPLFLCSEVQMPTCLPLRYRPLVASKLGFETDVSF